MALELGRAAAKQIRKDAPKGRKLRAIVARDTRMSGDFLDHAISAGLASEGVDVNRIGVVTTPCVAYLTAKTDVDLGVMISASHNPMPDNGIKFFARGGYKLPDAIEDQIEQLLGDETDRPIGESVGEINAERESAEKLYIKHLVRAAGDLSGLRVAVDCANGAASRLGPEALQEAGVDTVVINASPDGRNINDNCGSTHMESLMAFVKENHLDAGVAFDGDADRCLAVDNQGNLVDGDFVMAICALDMKSRGKLAKNTVVGTIMTNMGFIRFCEENGMNFVATKVGDRYVLEEMLLEEYSFGGERVGGM